MSRPGTRRSSLADYQLQVADALADPSDPWRGAEVIRWSILQWSQTQLTSVAPLTCGLLALRGRLADAVARDQRRADRPAEMHARGRAFLARLADDPDFASGLDDPPAQPDLAGATVRVGDVALLELALTAPAGRGPTLPEPWIWRRDPMAVSIAIMSGHDPHTVPESPTPILVHRDPDGRLQIA